MPSTPDLPVLRAAVAGPAGAPGPATARPVETVPTTLHDDGDHDRFAHYARRSDIVESAVTGRPVTALCGKVWVPNRDPDRYPVCPTCRDLYERKRAQEAGT